ncbi:MAG: PEP-utilizing enzyme [Acidimicrobiia bacterium]|nr:PEP-utilizing enzyme [Acidimicrobiia bacterium]
MNGGQRVVSAVRAALAARTTAAVVDALTSVEPEELRRYLHADLIDTTNARTLTVGLPASPGAASGRIALSAEDALDRVDAGQAVIIVRPETAPDDVLGMQVSAGIVTARGGLSSHAAVVARGWGIPAVVGAAEIRFGDDRVTIGSTVLHPGDELTVDGTTGSVYIGSLDTADHEAPPELSRLLRWADAVADGRVQVRVNADSGADARRGRELGARGIGLCRTEHMFLTPERLPVVRRFILAADPETESVALTELEEAQIQDFTEILSAMDGLPVTVRLLDPPLHEFLPDLTDLIAREARGELSRYEEAELVGARRLHETNPMIGTRGVRLGMMRNGLYQMQVRAVCQAAAALLGSGRRPIVEIMIPMVVDESELRIARSWVSDALTEIGHPELGVDTIRVGAMIETPRAALTAAAMAEHADFFSFGTNDLTQLTYAFSRDDVAARLLPTYQRLGILDHNPFAVLDTRGVGQLVASACAAARTTRPTIKLGACGEHAGHPGSVDFLIRQGLDSVSCSPFRVPMTRLAVAQALLASGRVVPDDLSFAFEVDADRTGHVDDEATGADDGGGTPGPGIDEALVLHVLRVRGFLTPDGFEASLGTMPADILSTLIATGHVRHLEARDMYSLLPEGRERHEALLPSYTGDELTAALAESYGRFLAHNRAFKELCTNWQLRNGEPNEHSDAAYDRSCIDALVALNDEARPALRSMAEQLPRLTRYIERLDDAATAVANGETKRFTGVMCESFHDVWMELHEDLIVLQGIDRVEEGSF